MGEYLAMLDNQRVLDILGQGLGYGKQKMDEYLKEKYKQDYDLMKHRLEGEKMELSNKLKRGEILQRAEIDRERAFVKAKAKAYEEEELSRINIGAVKKLKDLGYGFDEARDFLKITRGKGTGYTPMYDVEPLPVFKAKYGAPEPQKIQAGGKKGLMIAGARKYRKRIKDYQPKQKKKNGGRKK